MRSSEEAHAYLTEVRKLVRYLGICDGNMEEGSLRCDANISVMLKDAKEYGNRVEVKNMNSIRNVQKAIEFEVTRHIEANENNEEIAMETRSFDALKGTTISMRTKEAANDYRFFPEPDLQPITVSHEQIKEISDQMPALPRDLFLKYTSEFELSSYDAYNITDIKEIAQYYEEIVEHTDNYKAAANWLMGEIKSHLNQQGIEITSFPISAINIAELIKIIDEGKISSTIASQRIFPELVKNPEASPLEIAESLNLIQDSNEDSILTFIEEVIRQHPDEVKRYRGGEKQLVGFFMGQLMKVSKGKADPKAANQLMRQTLEDK